MGGSAGICYRTEVQKGQKQGAKRQDGDLNDITHSEPYLSA